MTSEQTITLVLKDQAGEYYLLPQQVLERGRVQAEQKAEVERLMNEEDVSGHFLWAYVLYKTISAATETGTLKGLPPRR